MSEPREWHTPKQVAELLQVNEQTVRAWLRDKLLTGHKFGETWRIRNDNLERFVEEAGRRGRRYEPSKELAVVLDAAGFELLQAFGDTQSVDLFIDTPLAENELCVSAGVPEAGMGSAAFVGQVWEEEAMLGPFRDVVAKGDTPEEVLLSLVQQLVERARSEKGQEA